MNEKYTQFNNKLSQFNKHYSRKWSQNLTQDLVVFQLKLRLNTCDDYVKVFELNRQDLAALKTVKRSRARHQRLVYCNVNENTILQNYLLNITKA